MAFAKQGCGGSEAAETRSSNKDVQRHD